MTMQKSHKDLSGIWSIAEYSDCEKYRYFLGRKWDDRKALAFIMLNPSTATEEQNDPTVARCERRARLNGYGGVQIYNLFAFRATDPKEMKEQDDPIGISNDMYLEAAIKHCADGEIDIICGWGTHGSFLDRDSEVLEIFEDFAVKPMALNWTKDGHPQHPLYVAYSAVPHGRK